MRHDCYTCKTEISYGGKSYSNTDKDICGVDEMEKYKKANTRIINGVWTITICKNK